MNEYDLAWGTQFEVIRFYSKSDEYRFEIDEYRSIFGMLRGNNAENAPKVREKLKELRDKRLERLNNLNRESVPAKAHGTSERESDGRGIDDVVHSSATLRQIKEKAAEAERTLDDPWGELDKEEEALVRGDKSGHGLTSKSDEGWYAGKGSFIIEKLRCPYL